LNARRRRYGREKLQSLELPAQRRVESPLPADAPKAPGWEKTCLQVGGPSRSGAVLELAGSWNGPALQPHRSRDKGVGDMESPDRLPPVRPCWSGTGQTHRPECPHG
jgi:hypothetical protein